MCFHLENQMKNAGDSIECVKHIIKLMLFQLYVSKLETQNPLSAKNLFESWLIIFYG